MSDPMEPRRDDDHGDRGDAADPADPAEPYPPGTAEELFGTDPDDPAAEADPGADTDAWRAFAGEEAPPEPQGSPVVFRAVTLGVGLAVFAAIVWLLLQ